MQTQTFKYTRPNNIEAQSLQEALVKNANALRDLFRSEGGHEEGKMEERKNLHAQGMHHHSNQ